ncbi:hypothetical protein K502DRAFT_362080 [Neoconidiobolus thromboides FSU 785]|nr:hypothetical protein K502DRAFT_362080 [Neoconidiobolus thromboides FSU 785]
MSSNIIDTSALPSDKPLSPERKRIISEILELYCCRPNEKYYLNFENDSKFQDPICDARNLTEIKAQFNAMPKAFSNSVTKSCKVVKNEKDTIHFDLVQEYTFSGLGYTKTMESTTVLDFNQSNKIINFEDRWNHSASWKDHSLLVNVQNMFRRFNAVALPHFISTN